MRKEHNFGYKKSLSLNSLMLIAICITFAVTLTIAFFYHDDFSTSMITMSGKVKIEAVGEGVCDCVVAGKTECEDPSHKSIEDTHTANLIITLDQDYEVVIPGMPLGIDANCKIYRSNTSPLLRARIDFELISALTGETVTDSQILISELYGQMISIIEDNNWFLHTDGYFYYVGDVTQPSGAANGTLLLKEIDVTATDKIIHFIDEPIRFPERITSDYSGFAVVFKITFQGIQNYIPQKVRFIYGNQVDNTIDNSQKIFSAFTDVFNYTTDLEYFTYTTSGSDVVINPNPNMIFTPNVELPTKDPDGRTINVVGDGFRGNAQIKSLVIPSSYDKIMPNAFRSSTLASVDMSKSKITELPVGCFQDTDLTKISLPTTMKVLKENCLYNTRLSTITLPNGLTTIEDGVLFNAPLTSIYIPASITSLGDDIFNSPYLVKIVVDNANPNYKDSSDIMMLSKDGKDLMLVASILTFSSLEVPNTVETVSSYAMYNANAKHIYFHEKVATIEDNAFSATYMEEIEVENTNPYLMTDDFALYNKNQTELIMMVDREHSVFTVPETVTKIKGSAFAYCDIGILNIGASVSSIQDTTFDFMTTTSIVVSNSNANFKDDNDIVLLNKNGTILYKYANANQTKTTYTLPTTVTTIERYAFVNSDKLTSITLPSNLDYIRQGAFAYCSEITTITLPTGIVETGYQAFYNCDNFITINLPESVTTIGEYAFYSCDSLTSVTIGNSVTTIGDYAFEYCTSLTSVNIPDSVKTIGEYAFWGCDSLTSVDIPDSVMWIGDRAFYECDSLKYVYCKATTPPALGGSWVFNDNVSGRRIIVPIGSGEAYKTAEYWSKYANDIFEDEF